MKKLLSIALVLIMLCSFSISALAASTTTLTTTVLPAEYKLNIPENQEIPFGAESTNIGNITVTEASGFAVGKNLAVTISYDTFSCADTTTKIPFDLVAVYMGTNTAVQPTEELATGAVLTFTGNEDTGVDAPRTQGSGNIVPLHHITVNITSENWGKALAGDYSATITFTAEVVAE